MEEIDRLIQSIPERFRPEKATGAQISVQFKLDGRPAREFEVIIRNGHCTVVSNLSSSAQCLVRTTAKHYIDLERGVLNPQMALMTGKVKVSSIGAMMQFAKYFRRYNPERSSAQNRQLVARPSKTGPLKDVRVIDLSRLLPGPMATLLMADMGADVIKVEVTPRQTQCAICHHLDGKSVFYSHLNRGKRSVAIDLNTSDGRERFLSLVCEADVVVEQFRPGVMHALGLGPEVLLSINPKVILCSITGYGQSGPMAHVAGHDINYMAWTGMLDAMRDHEGTPVVPSFQAADVAGGAYMAVSAILAALHEVRVTGVGRHLDVAMTDAMFHLQTLRLAEEQATGAYMADLSGARANYGVYVCADGLHIAVGALEPKFWEAFCTAVRRPQWASRILDQDQESLKREVSTLLLSAPRQHWLDILHDADACVAPVLSPLQTLEHPHFRHRNGKGHWPVFGEPVTWPAPELGADG